jgi:hypothetical protein
MGGKSEEGEKRLEYASLSGIESTYCNCEDQEESARCNASWNLSSQFSSNINKHDISLYNPPPSVQNSTDSAILQSKNTAIN